MNEHPYAGGRWSEAKYKSFIRSALRRAWMRWPVRADALMEARRLAQGRSKRTRWEYYCSSCEKWFLGSEVEIDHIKECGDMTDMNQFIGTLFCEADELRVLCKGCHRVRHK